MNVCINFFFIFWSHVTKVFTAWGLDVEVWGQTVQGTINTIRAAKATSQYILVPGTTWTGLAAWTSDSQPGLHNVTDPNNSIIFDVHQVRCSTPQPPSNELINISTSISKEALNPPATTGAQHSNLTSQPSNKQWQP